MSCIIEIPSNEKVGESLVTINSNFQCLGTAVDTLSGNLEFVNTNFGALSAKWEDASTVVQANSANWNEAYTLLTTLSGNIMSSPIKSIQRGIFISSLRGEKKTVTISPVDVAKSFVIANSRGISYGARTLTVELKNSTTLEIITDGITGDTQTQGAVTTWQVIEFN